MHDCNGDTCVELAVHGNGACWELMAQRRRSCGAVSQRYTQAEHDMATMAKEQIRAAVGGARPLHGGGGGGACRLNQQRWRARVMRVANAQRQAGERRLGREEVRV
nr:unnamed protein product [Digitaria exilis]